MPKPPTAPAFQSAADRLAAAQNEVVLLEQERTRVTDGVTVALLNGDDTSALNERLNEIAQRRFDLNLLIPELERRTRLEERAALVARLEAARDHRRARDKYFRETLRPAYDAALASLNEVQDRIEAFSKGSKPCEGFEPDYLFTAQRDLERHCAQFPNIAEDAE